MSSIHSIQATSDGTRIRILNVDDDPVARSIIRIALERAGFDAWSASSGPEAMDLMGRWGLPHLALVDVRMPGMSGFQFCDKVQEYLDLPMMMVSSVDDKETLVRSLQNSAEDYITKPFEPAELIARVKNLVKRLGEFPYPLTQRLRIDDRLEVELSQRLANVEGEEISLTSTETKLLHILMRNAGRTTFTDFLLRRMWPKGEVFEDALRTHVYRLRKKIEIDPREPRYVITKRGLGYSFPSLAAAQPVPSPGQVPHG